ncbi:hypothetical protein DSCA_40180 [Desulfosarcina alkanivorans]|uniref:NADP-dependent oxidoreductase domain-containing protein n=1 Tax=Desulfosarcina alkanivorans TaxID=571177 RepID=A0A5K7YMP4_9BACT|nr:aldo/keto reductase [Desulfosarcina alkanivorans]BBO70088.1 hypothetical protein DSCA_40180 [Desulfosarcina alkanivorans]
MKAHAAHPVTCIQPEYALFTRDVEAGLLPVLRQNGIGFVSYSPLGRGLRAGKLTRESIQDDEDFRRLLS